MSDLTAQDRLILYEVYLKKSRSRNWKTPPNVALTQVLERSMQERILSKKILVDHPPTREHSFNLEETNGTKKPSGRTQAESNVHQGRSSSKWCQLLP